MAKTNKPEAAPKNSEVSKTDQAPVAPATPEKALSLKERYAAMFHQEMSVLTGKASKGEPNIEGFEGNPKLMKYFTRYNEL